MRKSYSIWRGWMDACRQEPKPMKTIDQVREFHFAFGVHEQPINKIQNLRVELLTEELEELKAAIAWNDRVEILDALCDLQYVLDGAFIVFGFDKVKDAAFSEVHRSNMSKLGVDGKPMLRADGKIVPGPNFQPPNLIPFIHG